MKVKFILPSLSAFRKWWKKPVNYSLWPPIGLATLAGYLREDDEATLEDENIETVNLQDSPDIVALQVYVSSAKRSYEIADHYRSRGAHVCLGGVHATTNTAEALQHADSVFLGPGEDTWPQFLADYRSRAPRRVYRSTVRTLAGQPPPRRDLIKRHLYIAPNSLVVSRGCPHLCDFCSNQPFFAGGKGFYTQTIDQALAEINRLPGRHLYFLDDHIFGNKPFARELFAAMRGLGRVWQSAATIDSIVQGDLLDRAVESGLKTLLIGFETLSETNLRQTHKVQNLKGRYEAAVRRLHDAGVLINATFVFGLDDDDPTVFDHTVDWAISQGIETATFHILTPYPGTGQRRRLEQQGRILTNDWDLYDTEHVVFQPAKMTPQQLLKGYWRARRNFYSWSNLHRAAALKTSRLQRLRHLAYAGGWGRCKTFWNAAILAGQAGRLTPALESLLAASAAPAPQLDSFVGADLFTLTRAEGQPPAQIQKPPRPNFLPHTKKPDSPPLSTMQ